MIGALLLAACGGGGQDAPPPLPVAAEEATFASVAALGSFHLQAAVNRTITAGTTVQPSEETVEIRWRDQDHWSYRHGRDGRIRSEVVVWEGVAWSSAGGDPLERKGDAEPYRVQLASVWDPWAWGLESLAAAVAYDEGALELTDGRRLLRHTLSLAPPPPEPAKPGRKHAKAEAAEGEAPPAATAAKPRRGWTATAVQGDVWIDEATAVRLQGKVTVDAASGGRTQRVELLFSVNGIGVDPGVSPPVPGDKE